MDYFTTTFFISGHKWNTWMICKENNELTTIEYNSTTNVWRENGKKIFNFEKYCEENGVFIEQTKKNYNCYLNILHELKENIIAPLKHNDESVEVVVNNKYIDLKIVVHKILSKDQATIDFKIIDKTNEMEVEQLINKNQLVSFLSKNKHIINFKEYGTFNKKQDYHKLSIEYKKLFIKRSIEKRIYTQSCKEHRFKYTKDESLEEVQKFIRLNLESLTIN
jgi:hypothetical protein